MRYLILIIVILILLLGCAKQFYYVSKGVYYFEKPVQELTACSKIDPLPVENATAGLYVTGIPLSFNNRVYYPVETSFMSQGVRISQTAIYALNPETNNIEDSMLIKEPNINRSYQRLVANNDILIIGIKDKSCHIIKTDTQLEVIDEYDIPIKANFIAYADIVSDKLRLVVGEPNNDIAMYELIPTNMQVERKRLLAKGYFRHYQDGQNLWFFADTDSEIEVVKLDMSASDPSPITKSFAYAVKNLYGKRVYSAKAAGNNVYIGYSLRDDLNGGVSMLLSINFEDGTMQKREINRFLSFDLLHQNDKTYLYRTAQVNDKSVLTISELATDLQETEPEVIFYLSEMHMVGRIISDKNNNVFLTGNYHQPQAKKQKVSSVELTNKSPNGLIFKPFLAIFQLK
jgi:hypothetical protein